MNNIQRAKIGGQARSKSLSRIRRKEIARQAANARWLYKDPREIIHNREAIASLCQKYGIKTLIAFGSVLGPDFKKNSDVDLLYLTEKQSLGFDSFFSTLEDFEKLFGRKVDLISMTVVDNSHNEFFRRSVFENNEVIYGQ
jgi:predicted nucleotidyltransferase